MARKENTANAPERAPVEILGIVLIALSLLLLFALFSYDKYDVHYTQEPAHSPKHNFIGSVGAYGAYYIFFVFGAGAYLIPILLIVFGFAHFSGALAYLRKRSMVAWAAVLVLCCMALLSQYTDDRAVEAIQKHLPNNAGFLEKMSANINSPSAGGIIGLTLRDRLLVHIGRVGAPILLITVYLIALVFLSDFHLIDMIRNLRKAEVKGPDSSEAEEELERKARDLEKQAKKLKDEVEKTAKTKAKEEAKAEPEPEPEPVQAPKDTRVMGADMQPVPEPTVRDLSVPQPRPPEPEPVEQPKPSRRAKKTPEPGSENIVQEGDIIPAEEVKAAATPEQILGRPSKAKKSESPPEPAREEKSPVSQETAPVEAGAMAPTGAPEPVLVNADTETKSGIDEKSSTETPVEIIPVAAVAAPAEPLPPVPVPRPRPQPKKPKPITVASTPMIGNYRLPLLDFLQMPDLSVKPTETKEELMANAQLMKNTLAQFDIDVSLGDITKGPTITRYELHPAPGVKLEKITALNNNIAAALKAERINILAPVPGKSSVGVEVPNLVKTKVIMRDLLESPEWQTSKARIPLALGKDVYGHPIVADLAEMPHCLIAGSTGSGKSVCINSIIASLLYRFSPDQLRFVMIDPKVVELQQYNALPHLVVPVVTDPKKVILALRWVVNEMEKRYQIFARVGVRNIKSFNDRPKEKDAEKLRAQRELELPLTAKKEKIEPGSDGFAVQLDEEIVVPRDEDIIIPEKLSYIVVIIDELADLMLVAPADVEMAIARITQMARAAGIHCIVATQRPSVDVITGVIKANIPARIAFQVAAKVDSRTILDAMGADKLLGKGDMLYLPPGSARLIRAQGVLITDQEIQSVVDFIAQQGKPSYEMEIHQQLQKPTPSFGAEESGCGEDEAIIEQCIEVIRSEQKASVSLLQRRLKLGYGRAARIMDELENRGIVGPSKGAEPRDILIDLDGGGADGAGQ